MSKFRKKPVVIEAMQWTGASNDDDDPVAEWILDGDGDIDGERKEDGWHLFIVTLEGRMEASPGDWIIKGVQGEFYPCKPDIFEATYQKPDAASLRARPQEPGLSKEWLDAWIDAEWPESDCVQWRQYRTRRDGARLLRDAILSAPSGPLSDEPRELEWETTADGRRTWLRKSGLWRVSRGRGGTVWLMFADAHLKCVDSIEEAQSLAASLQSILDGRPPL